MKQIALTIEQMKHLQELGVDTSGASMCWIGGEVLALCDKTVQQIFCNANVPFFNDNNYEPAFTLQDILELLPQRINEEYQLQVISPCIAYRQYNSKNEDLFYSNYKDILKNAYQALCWCLEDGHLKNKEE